VTTPGYFATVRLRLIRGRFIGDGDQTPAPEVVVIHQAAADRFFADREPIGQMMAWWGSAKRIVGVVANEKFQGATSAALVAAYVPFAQSPRQAGTLLVRSAGSEAIDGRTLVRVIRVLDPQLPVFGVERLADTMARSVAARRFTMLLLGLFAATALVLAAIGVHGLLSYNVTQRVREIGIRLALGARPGALPRAIVAEGFVLVLAGLAIGGVGAIVLSRLARALLFAVSPADPLVYIATGALLVAVAGLASLGPALRATRVDPGRTLRSD